MVLEVGADTFMGSMIRVKFGGVDYTTWMIHISYWYDGLALLKRVEYSFGKGGKCCSNFSCSPYQLLPACLP